MKKYIFLFIIIMLAIIPTIVNADTIDSIDMNIFINSSGDATVTEIWNTMANEKTEYYHSYYNLYDFTIKNLKVSDEDREYETISSWNPSGDFDTKKYKCGLNHIPGGFEICWGKSEYGRKTYTVEYEITNFVIGLTDAQMAYWTLIPKWHDKYGRVNIEIKSDFEYEDTLDVWSYGKKSGLCYVSDGTIKMSTDGKSLPSSDYMTILVKFPQGTFDTQSNKRNSNFESYLNMAENRAEHYEYFSVTKIVLMMFMVAFPILLRILAMKNKVKRYKLNISFILYGLSFFLLLFTFSWKEDNMLGIFSLIMCSVLILTPNIIDCISEKEKSQIKKAEYYRDIPCNKDIFKAYYIASIYKLNKNKEDFLGAILLKWLNEEKISIIKRDDGLLGEEECIHFNFDYSEIEEGHERTLYRYMIYASKGRNLDKNEFKSWCEVNYKNIFCWFDDVCDCERKKLLENGDIKEKKFRRFKRRFYGENVLNEAVKLSGLKKYLEDYTLIYDREAIEVELLEDYLIYAQMLGIAEKVKEEFRHLYPELIEQSNFVNFDSIDMLMVCAYEGIKGANSGIANSLFRGGHHQEKVGGGSFSGGSQNE